MESIFLVADIESHGLATPWSEMYSRRARGFPIQVNRCPTITWEVRRDAEKRHPTKFIIKTVVGIAMGTTRSSHHMTQRTSNSIGFRDTRTTRILPTTNTFLDKLSNGNLEVTYRYITTAVQCYSCASSGLSRRYSDSHVQRGRLDNHSYRLGHADETNTDY